MVIELDERKKIEVPQWSPEMAARITRPRALRILELIAKAREVIIRTHPEPDVVRVVYASEWMRRMVVSDPRVIDPNGTIRFLQEIDDLFNELGLADDLPQTPPGDPDFEETVEEEAEREAGSSGDEEFAHPVYGKTAEEDG